MNKFILLFLSFFITIHLQSQTGLQITSTCQNDSLCLPANECVAINQTFSISAATDCSTSNIIEYNFSIDWNDDGTIDSLGSTASFTTDFPLGNHRVKFTAFDICGDEENCEFVFEVMDCVAPVIETTNYLFSFIIPSSGQIEIFPEPFISTNTFDNCTSYENLILSISHSFNANTNDTSLYINCSDIQCDGIIPIAIWVEDEFGNQDSINIDVLIIDPSGVCSGFPLFTHIDTYFWTGIPMENSIFWLNNNPISSSFINPYPCNGIYSLEGDTIFVENDVDDNPLNGVTTYDLVLIAKHILGTQLFYSPYQSIAADVNLSGTITALDLVTIRSLILHITDQFPSGKSWIYDPPFIVIDEYEESYEFIGIKLGDVNGSANPNDFQNSPIDSRTFDGTFNLFAKNKTFKTGETVAITTFSDNYKNIAGGQFTIDFDPTALLFQKIEGNNSIGLSEQNFGKTQVNDGFILCSWNTSTPQNLNRNNEFFEITFTAKKDGRLSDFISINSKKLVAEIYVENGNEIEFWNTDLNFENEETEIDFSISPNPFSEKTTFNFSLKNAGSVELEIFDMNGRLVSSHQKNMLVGKNQIEIQKSILPNKGIYFYKIKTDNNVNSGKIISQ